MGLRMLGCTVCSYASHRVDSLKHHMRTVHSIEGAALENYQERYLEAPSETDDQL